MPGTQTDPRVETAKQWRKDVYHQNKAVAHGGKDQQQTEYAVIKSCDMSDRM